MTDAAIQTEVVDLTKLKPKKGETAEDYTKRVVDKVNKMADADSKNWDKLSEEAQAWSNTNVTAAETGTELKLLALPDEDDESEEAVGAQPVAEGESIAEPEENPEEEAPVKKTKAKAPAKVPAKKVAAAKPAAKKAASPVKKPAPAKAAAPKKAKNGDRGRAPLFPDTGVIKVLVKENPHRDGTIRDKAFKKVKSGMTVAEAVKAGCPRQQVWSMYNREIISIKSA